MDTAPRHRRRGLIQNIAIALLSVSAVLLFTQLQLYNLDTPEDPHYLERLMGTLPSGSPTELREFPVPVRVVLTDSYGRYGSLGLTTNSDGFSALGLREALGSVQALTVSNTDGFRAALSGVSIYFDFLDPLPVPVVAGLIGVESSDLTGTVRGLLLSAGAGDSVRLYLWDGSDGVVWGTVPDAALSPGALEEAVSQSGFEGVSFAFDDVAVDPLYGQLFPLSILPTELPELPVLSASIPASDADRLMVSLGFNVNTRDRYTESDGTQVITEAETNRSLHIHPDGEIVYRGGTESPLVIAAQEEAPTASEAALGAFILLQTLTENITGDGTLYLLSVQQMGETTQLRYGYHIGGVPIRFSDGGCAAEVTLAGTAVTELSLRLRQYTASGESSLLLPLRQTLAIAAEQPGAELSLGYADTGGDTVSANWLSD